MRILKDSWVIIVILTLLAVCVTTLCQRNNVLQRYEVAVQRYEAAEITIKRRDKRRDKTIDCLKTMCRLQAEEIDLLHEKDFKNVDDIRGYKARAEALEGRIRKMAGAYHVREMKLLDEIEWLNKYIRYSTLPPIKVEVDENGEVIRPKMSPGFPVGKGKHDGWVHPPQEIDNGRHNQSEARSRMAHPEKPDRLSEDTGMGCGGDARERFSTRHPRLVPLQKGFRRKMGRR